MYDRFEINGFCYLTGKHKETGTKYNKEGYNIDGYDELGYDKEGYDINGYDKRG